MSYFDPNYNPLLDPVEEDYRNRVDQFVKDLAWGVLAGYLSPKLNSESSHQASAASMNYLTGEVWRSKRENKREISYYIPSYEFGVSDELKKQFIDKWQLHVVPTKYDLQLWGYVEKESGLLTHMAFDLLYVPSTAPTVFISYRHIASSTLALAIEARLKYLGNNNTFIDKELSPGKRFDNEITTAIKNCDYFVLLVDKQVFDSKWVKKEFELAKKLDKAIIPILHPNIEENDLKAFSTEGFDRYIQYIDCKGISAADYESAINRLLNTLGYATY